MFDHGIRMPSTIVFIEPYLKLCISILFNKYNIIFGCLLVGHVIQFQNAQEIYGRFDYVTTRFLSPQRSKSGILFVIFLLETNLNFSRRLIRFSILGCDLDNASLAKWRHEKRSLDFKICHLIFTIRMAPTLCMKVLIQ